MQTRSQMHREQEETNQLSERGGHHVGFRLLGILVMTFFMVSLILNRTVLNRHFVVHEMTSSALETPLLSRVRSGLGQYGISRKVLTKKETDKIVTTAVDQALAGQKLKLDLSSVVNRLGDQAEDSLSSYGISASLPSGSSNLVASSVNSAVNSQINTAQVTAAIKELHFVRTAVNVILVTAALGLAVLAIAAWHGGHLLASFSWIATGGLLISGLLTVGGHSLIPQLAQANPDFSSFAVQCADDFQSAALTWLGVLAVAAVVLWLLRLTRSLFGSVR